MSIFGGTAGTFAPDDNITFGPDLANAPVNAEDNDSYMVTTTGVAPTNLAEVLAFYKYDAETATWVEIPIDTDIQSVDHTLGGVDGDDLTTTVTEDGNAVSDTIDLEPILTAFTFSGPTLGAPVISGGEQDNDTHWVTSDGSETGAVLEIWKYDEQTNQWLAQPVGGALHENVASCVALRNLRNAGDLEPGRAYRFPHSQGTFNNAVFVTLIATEADSVSANASYRTGWDTNEWRGAFDLDTCTAIEVYDNRGNHIFGSNVVSTFPWGNASLNRNTIDHAALFSWTAGTFNDNYIKTAAVRVTGGATDDSEFTGLSVVTISGGNIDRVKVSDAANFTVSAGTVFSLTVDGDSNVTHTGAGRLINSRISASNYTNAQAGNIDRLVMENLSTFTKQNGANFDDVRIVNQAVVTTGTGTGYLRDTTVSNYSRVLNLGSVRVAQCHIDTYTDLNVSGSSGYIDRVKTSRSILSQLLNATLAIRDTTVGYAGIRALDSGAILDISGLDIRSGSNIYARNSSTVYIRNSDVSGASIIDVRNTGRVDIVSMKISNLARLYNFSTTAAARLYARYGTILGGTLYMYQTASNAVWDYSHIGPQSQVYIYGTTAGIRCYRNEIGNYGRVWIQNMPAGGTFDRNRVTAGGRMYLRNCSGAARIYGSVAEGEGLIINELNTAVWVYECAALTRGYIRARGVSGRLYRSTFSDYFYGYIDVAGFTVQALNGHGRQTFTKNFTANFTAPGTKNFT